MNADVGQTITVDARYTDVGGANEAVLSNSITGITDINNAPAGNVTISTDGTPAEGETLSVTDSITDADGLGAITYHWQRNGIDIGITGSSYTLVNADVGQTITVEARYTDVGGTDETVLSNSIDGIANVNDAPEGAVTISSDGTPAENEMLSVTDTLIDEDGIGEITYHWQRNGSDIGSIGSSYVLVEEDVGQVITVEARYTDRLGASEALQSNSINDVANVNDAPSGSVTIISDGSPTENETLTVNATLKDADGLGEIIFHWQRNGSDIGAVGSSYTLVNDDVGQVITVDARYTDAQGSTENVVSSEAYVDKILKESITEVVISVVETENETTQQVKDTSTEPVAEVEEETKDELIEVVVDEAVTVEPLNVVTPEQEAVVVIEPVAIAVVTDEAKPNHTIKPLSLAIGNQISVVTDLKASWVQLSDPLLLVNSSGFMHGLDEMEKDFQNQITLDQMVVGSGIAMSTGLSIGYVTWLLRSGILLSSVLTSLPAWRFIDPLPILSKMEGDDYGLNEEDEDSLESLVQKESKDEASVSKDS